jgi:hypothetical protein
VVRSGSCRDAASRIAREWAEVSSTNNDRALLEGLFVGGTQRAVTACSTDAE